MEYIKDKIDFRQYGGQRGNSITHYLIEFINFILSSQDSADQTAILAVMVDFCQAQFQLASSSQVKLELRWSI